MSSFLLQWETWVYGLVAGFIGGGAQAVVATVTVTAIAPDKFNLGAQLHNFLILAAVTFTASGLLSAAAYLAKSPLPQIVTTVATEKDIEPTAAGVHVSSVTKTTEAPVDPAKP
jgi:hypothetical protein